MQAYDWPGNVRELENIIERAIVLCNGERLNKGEWVTRNKKVLDNTICTLAENERRHMLKALQATNWQIGGRKGASTLLGMKRTNLQKTRHHKTLNNALISAPCPYIGTDPAC